MAGKILTPKKGCGPHASGAALGFEDKLWAAADKLRGNMDATIRKNLEALGYGE